jgi:hypothetical protein
MSEPIFARQTMRNRGADAFKAGKDRNEHHMNHGALAIPLWQEGWDQAAADAKADRELCGLSHIAPATRARIDLRQVEAA